MPSQAAHRRLWSCLVGCASEDEHGDMNDSKEGRIRILGLLVIIAGAVLVVAGVITYIAVSSKLSDQEIAVSDDAAHFAGQKVTQPWQAYAEANTIAKHATAIAGGKTYAQLPADDPNRQTVMIASFLQASLFTSVVAFGLAVMAVGLGVVFILIGMALRATAHADDRVRAGPQQGASQQREHGAT
jgi:hypothetical protein